MAVAAARPAGVRAVHTNQMTDVELAKTWAAHYGFFGTTGGWICDPQGQNVVQGWDLFAQILVDMNYIEVGVGIHWRVVRGGESVEVATPRFSRYWSTRDGRTDLARRAHIRHSRKD